MSNSYYSARNTSLQNNSQRFPAASLVPFRKQSIFSDQIANINRLLETLEKSKDSISVKKSVFQNALAVLICYWNVDIDANRVLLFRLLMNFFKYMKSFLDPKWLTPLLDKIDSKEGTKNFSNENRKEILNLIGRLRTEIGKNKKAVHVAGNASFWIEKTKKRIRSASASEKWTQKYFKKTLISMEKVGFKDPFSFVRIKFPVRGKNCNHLRVFDLETYIVRWFSTNGKKSSRSSWLCPICEIQTHPRDLYVDGCVFELIKKYPGKNELLLNSDLEIVDEKSLKSRKESVIELDTEEDTKKNPKQPKKWPKQTPPPPPLNLPSFSFPDVTTNPLSSSPFNLNLNLNGANKSDWSPMEQITRQKVANNKPGRLVGVNYHGNTSSNASKDPEGVNSNSRKQSRDIPTSINFNSNGGRIGQTVARGAPKPAELPLVEKRPVFVRTNLNQRALPFIGEKNPNLPFSSALKKANEKWRNDPLDDKTNLSPNSSSSEDNGGKDGRSKSGDEVIVISDDGEGRYEMDPGGTEKRGLKRGKRGSVSKGVEMSKGSENGLKRKRLKRKRFINVCETRNEESELFS